MPSVFISKNLSEVPELEAFCNDSGYQLIAKSMISFEPIQFKVESDFDVVFFSSPRSVMFFLRQFSVNDTTKIAAVGNKTAEVLKALNYNVDFEGSGDPSETALAFKEWVGPRRVLFPISSNSLKSISQELDSSQVEEVVVYETVPNPSTIAPCDIYFFTSPSNLEAFITVNNTLASASKIFAWGSSTSAALKKEGLDHKIMSKPSISEVLYILQQLT